MARDHALRPLHFAHHLARIRRNVLMQVQLVIGAADERLGQINRIVDDRSLTVSQSPCRIQCSATVALSLRAMPLRRI